MKKILLIFMVSLCMTSFIFAEKVNLITFEYQPYLKSTEDGLIDELVEAILSEAGYEVERSYFYARRSTAQFVSSKNKNDVLLSATLYTEGLKNITPISLFNIRMVLMYNTKYNKNINPEKLESLKGKRLGTISRSASIEKFEKAGAIIEEAAVDANLKKLESGRIDMLNIVDLSAIEAMESYKEFAVSKAYLSFSVQMVIKKENTKLYEECKKAFEKLVRNGKYLELLEKYYGKNKVPKELLRRK